MSCSQVRRELLEHFAFREELEARSAPHLAHLESCAECRQEVGIDQALVMQLRRALRERVEGSTPSAASWELVRRRAVDGPRRAWTGRLLRLGRMLPAVVVGVLMFATATAPGTRPLPEPQSPGFVASSARRAVPPAEEASGLPRADATAPRLPQADGPPPGWPMETRPTDPLTWSDGEPPITRWMP